MKRADLLKKIRSFEPEVEILDGGHQWLNWCKLDPLIEALFDGSAHDGIDAMLRVFERHPGEHNDWFWGMLHGIESLLGYERKLVASFRRCPTDFTGMMILRILNGGQTHLGKVDLAKLLRDGSRKPGVSKPVRKQLRDFARTAAARAAERREKPDLKQALAALEAADPQGDREKWWALVANFARAEPDMATVFAIYERFPVENHRTWNQLNHRIEHTRGYVPKALAAFVRKPTTGTAYLIARLAAAGDRRAIAAARKAPESPGVTRTLKSFM